MPPVGVVDMCGLSESAALRCRRSGIEELRNGGDQLRGRERLFQKDAIGTPRGPFVGAIAGYVDDGKIRIDPLACLPPFVLPARGLFLSLSVPAKKPVQNGNLTGGGRI